MTKIFMNGVEIGFSDAEIILPEFEPPAQILRISTIEGSISCKIGVELYNWLGIKLPRKLKKKKFGTRRMRRKNEKEIIR